MEDGPSVVGSTSGKEKEFDGIFVGFTSGKEKEFDGTFVGSTKGKEKEYGPSVVGPAEVENTWGNIQNCVGTTFEKASETDLTLVGKIPDGPILGNDTCLQENGPCLDDFGPFETEKTICEDVSGVNDDFGVCVDLNEVGGVDLNDDYGADINEEGCVDLNDASCVDINAEPILGKDGPCGPFVDAEPIGVEETGGGGVEVEAEPTGAGGVEFDGEENVSVGDGNAGANGVDGGNASVNGNGVDGGAEGVDRNAGANGG